MTYEPPSDIVAEQSVLGAALLGGSETLQLVKPILSASDFYRDAHREIYLSLSEMDKAHQGIDIVTLRAELEKQLLDRGGLDAVGGLAYLMQLADTVPGTANVVHYANTVKEQSNRRRVVESFAELSSMVQAGMDTQALYQSAQAKLTELGNAFAGQATPAFTATPSPLSVDLLPVPDLDGNLLPPALRGWIWDIAARVGCPPDYIAATVMVALGAVLGRRIGIRPKRHDDWTVLCNLWGAVVGRPGVLKTPAVSEALKPLHRLEQRARDTHTAELEAWEADAEIRKVEQTAAKANLARKAKQGASREELRELARQAGDTEDEQPLCERFILNDATTEKTGELLRDNPNGLLIYRDELAGFLKALDKQGHEADRAFYLEAWNGTGSFTYDRIGRGTQFIPSLCLSLFGTIQPGPLSSYLRAAANGAGADGFVPRFQLLVYPDPPRQFINIDRYPDAEKKNAAFAVFEHLSSVTPAQVGAELPEEGGIPFLRFSQEAQNLFDGWREQLENRIIEGNESPLILEHLAKYRSLMPSLALLLHLANGDTGPVTKEAAERAVQWCAFLEAHARRVYHASTEADTESAGRLAERIRQSLPNPFTVKDVYRKGWSGLSSPEEAEKAVSLLEGRNWLKGIERQTERGGRPTVDYWIHPDLLCEKVVPEKNNLLYLPQSTVETVETPTKAGLDGFDSTKNGALPQNQDDDIEEVTL